MDFHIVVPARYDSKRLPGKALVDMNGQPMIQRVVTNAYQSGAATVTVATDDARIEAAVRAFGGDVLMTSPTHQSGTDRIAEAVGILGLSDDDVVVNIQGDEPFMPVAAMTQVADLLMTHRAPMSTLCKPMTDWEKVQDPNVVKVVCNAQGQALYFSRAVIPHLRIDVADEAHMLPEMLVPYMHHIGIYAYRVDFLKRYVAFGPCAIEVAERLEQLRALWHGFPIQVGVAKEAPPTDINTLADLEEALKRLDNHD